MKMKGNKTICLTMIVKNEEIQLPRCFSTIKEHIDTWCIVDTGSTDNTIQVIKDQLKDIPGQVISRPWVNFGHNRSESLGFAKNKADYLLLCDADEQIVFAESFDKNELTQDHYMIKYNGNLDYRVPYLISTKKDWTFVGVTHEYLSCTTDFTQGKLDTITINDYGDGGSKHGKFERDIRLLTSDLEKDPNNARSMFYLANSYRDIHQNQNAIDWYQRRIDAGGWIEEVTCSYLYKGTCLERLGKTHEAINTYLKGYEHNRNRAECIYNAIRLLRTNGLNVTAYLLAKEAKKIPYPKDDILFIEKDVYTCKIDYELSIVTYYADPDEDIRGMFKNLIFSPCLDHQNVISNYAWYCKSLEPFEIDCFEFTEDSESWQNSSPSIFPYGDGYGINVRQVSYIINQQNGSYGEKNPNYTKGKINTGNFFIELDKDFTEINRTYFLQDDHNENAVNGIEDVKVINDNGIYKFTGTKWYDYGKIGIVHGNYATYKAHLKYDEIKSPFHRPVEKNWVPYLTNDGLSYIYDWNPVRYGYINDEGLFDLTTTDTYLPNFRGSSPGFAYDGHIYFLVHVVEYGTPRHYYHSIVRFDSKTMEYVDHSKLFTFEGKKIEYGLGLIIEDERVIISHSVWDQTAQIKVYDKDKLFDDIF